MSFAPSCSRKIPFKPTYSVSRIYTEIFETNVTRSTNTMRAIFANSLFGTNDGMDSCKEYNKNIAPKFTKSLRTSPNFILVWGQQESRTRMLRQRTDEPTWDKSEFLLETCFYFLKAIDSGERTRQLKSQFINRQFRQII